MKISEIYRRSITPINLNNTLREAIFRVLIIRRKLPLVYKDSLVGVLTDSDLLNILFSRKYGINEKIKNIEYIHFPLTIRKEDNINKAINIMKNYNLGSIIVVNNFNYPEYILKDFELLDFIDVEGAAKEFMTKNPICAKFDSNENLLKMIVFSKFRTLPVIDKDKNFIGILNVEFILKSIYLNNFRIPKNLIKKVETFSEDESIGVIKRYLRYNEAAIITKDEKVIGIITPYDIIKRFGG